MSSSSNSTEHNTVEIGNLCMRTFHQRFIYSVKLLSINSEKYIKDICQKTLIKVNAFARPIKGVTERRTVMNAFFISQFNYCSLIYMCCSRSLNNKIDRLHARCLQIIHCDKLLSFYELLEKDISASIHHQDIRELAIEIFIVFNG